MVKGDLCSEISNVADSERQARNSQHIGTERQGRTTALTSEKSIIISPIIKNKLPTSSQIPIDAANSGCCAYG